MRFLQIKNNILSMLRRPFNKYYGGLTGYTSKYFSRPERLTQLIIWKEIQIKKLRILEIDNANSVIRNKEKCLIIFAHLLPEKSNFYEFGTWTEEAFVISLTKDQI